MENKPLNTADDLSAAHGTKFGRTGSVRDPALPDSMNSPTYIKAAAEHKQRYDVERAQNDLQAAIILVGNKGICPLLVQASWNAVMQDKPIGYLKSCAICFGVACLRSFATFSWRDAQSSLDFSLRDE